MHAQPLADSLHCQGISLHVYETYEMVNVKCRLQTRGKMYGSMKYPYPLPPHAGFFVQFDPSSPGFPIFPFLCLSPLPEICMTFLIGSFYPLKIPFPQITIPGSFIYVLGTVIN